MRHLIGFICLGAWQLFRTDSHSTFVAFEDFKRSTEKVSPWRLPGIKFDAITKDMGARAKGETRGTRLRTVQNLEETTYNDSSTNTN